MGRCARPKSGRQSGTQKNQRTIGAAKTEVVFNRHINLRIPRCIGAEIQITSRVLVEDIDGRRDFLVIQRQHGIDRFDAASTTQQVTGHRLG